jgi:putative phage-type endonuclease
MRLIDIEQGSKEWLEMRKSKITATDVGAIVGANPWKTPLELYEEKLGLIPAQLANEKMIRGQMLEPVARDILCKDLKKHFEPVVCIHDGYQYMMASLDGITADGSEICEIKCPSSVRIHREHLNHIIAPYYICQVQHQLFCSGAKKCYFCSYHPDHEIEFIVHVIEPHAEMMESLFNKCTDFYMNHLTKFNPPTEWRIKLRYHL